METIFNLYINDNYDKNYYFGFVVLFLGILIFIFNFSAFVKMTNYLGKMNFENTIILLSSIQSVVLIEQMIFLQYDLINVFLFLQINSLCLINHKFQKISEGYFVMKYKFFNLIIFIINILFFITSIIKFIWDIIQLSYFEFVYIILEIFTSFFLTYYCQVYLRLIKKRLKEDSEQKNIKEKDNFPGTYMAGNEIFYKIRQKQYSCLYLTNILFSFLEFIFDILLKIRYNNNKKEELSLNYMDFFSFFILFIHNSTNFMSFYWIIRKQYTFKSSANVIKNEELIDEKYIEDEAIHIGEENKRITKYLNDDKNLKNKISDDLSLKNDKKSIAKMSSRNSTFDENDLINTLNNLNNKVEDDSSN
jgi:hypothetical protein